MQQAEGREHHRGVSEMSPMLELEVGEDEQISQCGCCHAEFKTGHGFIYKDHSPYAVYYAGWSAGHKERGVTLALAIGKWEENSTAEDRACFGLEAYEGERQVLFRFIDPESSPWQEAGLLGPMIRRQAALAHSLRNDALAVAELIVREHPGVSRFLGVNDLVQCETQYRLPDH
jgi:hypothetical protein